MPIGLSYLILEHSGVGPIDFLRCVINDYNFGILFLGSDAPSLFSIDQAKRFVHQAKREGIMSSIEARFPWIPHNEVCKLCKKDWFTLEGDALILKTSRVLGNFECTRLPDPSGFNKDKISPKDIDYLNSFLIGDDTYIHDDFTETFIVSKNPDVLDIIVQEINKRRE